ncbi:MAG: 4-hydroxy-3-methylbut-2-en-1-yl diphosphate synthase [Spartobacteria bacterium AMD-G4]|nr:MAG: 4-hydroxy-3-methylbut-2-en-1-yl diphosphate synthase [Spartobacteria bacterium AMD-G4]
MSLVFRSHPGRRPSREVKTGRTAIGGENPVRVQSMLTSDTMDTAACVRETLGLAQAGCEIVRITAPTVKDARNLEAIRDTLRAAGCEVPLVADIHFKPDAALEAAKWVDKVRINPGNFADSKKFHIREYTDTEYAAEISRIRERFGPLVALCKDRGVSMRIGTNHGSLSDRIMNRFGDTPLGMVESALEFARIARELDYHDFVFSMKASNPKVMIQAYRLLVARLDKLEHDEGGGWNYPIHLGVTEAGDGEDGRIKSAIGIGSLLADGIGDTIRVSLTEDSEHEIPVAQALEKIAAARKPMPTLPAWPFDPFSYARRASSVLQVGEYQIGGVELVRVAVAQAAYDKVAHKIAGLGDYKPELIIENCALVEIDPCDAAAVARVNASPVPLFVTIPDSCDLPVIGAYRLLASLIEARHPILLKDTFTPGTSTDFVDNLLNAATNIGSLLCDGIGDAVLVQGDAAPGQSLRIAYNTLQAAGVRIFKTDYVACPSCGRTLFNLQETTARIKIATNHLKGVKIAIMGCIVNGPGEMADADFGYVGGAPGKVNLYVGKTPVKFNIPQTEAVDRLVDLIREHGRWVEQTTAV